MSFSIVGGGGGTKLIPTAGATIANWNTGIAGSGLLGATLTTLGLSATVKLVGKIALNTKNITAGANLTVRNYENINGEETLVYRQTFSIGSDPQGLVVFNGDYNLSGLLRVEVYSDKASDNGKEIKWEYLSS